MIHQIRVGFDRQVEENIENAQVNFPGLPLGQQLRKQFRAELDLCPELQGRYSIPMVTILGGVELYTVVFEVEHENYGMACLNLATQLQGAFDKYGITGTFQILPDAMNSEN